MPLATEYIHEKFLNYSYEQNMQNILPSLFKRIKYGISDNLTEVGSSIMRHWHKNIRHRIIIMRGSHIDEKRNDFWIVYIAYISKMRLEIDQFKNIYDQW